MTAPAVTPNAVLADRAVALGRGYPPCTPGRRAAAYVYAALATTRTAEAARRVLVTFGDPAVRADALALLSRLEQEAPESERTAL
jgi:hypothetical protein